MCGLVKYVGGRRGGGLGVAIRAGLVFPVSQVSSAVEARLAELVAGGRFLVTSS